MRKRSRLVSNPGLWKPLSIILTVILSFKPEVSWWRRKLSMVFHWSNYIFIYKMKSNMIGVEYGILILAFTMMVKM